MRARILILLAASAALAVHARPVPTPPHCASQQDCACPRGRTPTCGHCPAPDGTGDKVCFCTLANTAAGAGCGATSARQLSPHTAPPPSAPPPNKPPPNAPPPSIHVADKPASEPASEPRPRAAINTITQAPPPARGRLSAAAGVGIGFGALALIALGCVGACVVLRGRRREKERGVRGSRRAADDNKGGGARGAAAAKKAAAKAKARPSYNPAAAPAGYGYQFPTTGAVGSPALPPPAPAYFHYACIPLAPGGGGHVAGGDGSITASASSDGGVHSVFLEANDPPSARITWRAQKGRGETDAAWGDASVATEVAGATPPPDAGGGKDVLASTAGSELCAAGSLSSTVELVNYPVMDSVGEGLAAAGMGGLCDSEGTDGTWPTMTVAAGGGRGVVGLAMGIDLEDSVGTDGGGERVGEDGRGARILLAAMGEITDSGGTEAAERLWPAVKVAEGGRGVGVVGLAMMIELEDSVGMEGASVATAVEGGDMGGPMLMTAMGDLGDSGGEGGEEGTWPTAPVAHGGRGVVGLAMAIDLEDSVGTQETGTTPPPVDSGLREDESDMLASAVDLGTSSGTEGTRGTGETTGSTITG